MRETSNKNAELRAVSTNTMWELVNGYIEFLHNNVPMTDICRDILVEEVGSITDAESINRLESIDGDEELIRRILTCIGGAAVVGMYLSDVATDEQLEEITDALKFAAFDQIKKHNIDWKTFDDED